MLFYFKQLEDLVIQIKWYQEGSLFWDNPVFSYSKEIVLTEDGRTPMKGREVWEEMEEEKVHTDKIIYC